LHCHSVASAEGSNAAHQLPDPTLKYKGMLVSFAAYKNHGSFFQASYAVIRKFHKELRNFDLSTGTIRFALDKPLPAALLRKMVKARIAEKERK
jgi:uncharacterized protein YdhG (YjbR/CyaY superfamily)